MYKEDEAVVVEWCYKWYDKSMGNDRFEFLGDDDTIMTEVYLPDNSSVYVKNEDEAKEILDDFLKEHPYYKKNEWGRWYNENEHKEWKEWFKEIPTTEDFDEKDNLTSLHIGDHTDHTEDGYDVPFKSLEKYRDCADCPQENGVKITCDECDDYKAKQRMEDYFDIVECTANDEQGENCDNECDTCKYNSNKKGE